MKKVRIGKRLIGEGEPCFIIAEAGVNHNGDVKLAMRMVDAAIAAGADAVKFQTFRAEGLVTRSAPKAEYQKAGAREKTQFDMLKRLELPEAAFKKLFDYCKDRGISFLSTPFDPRSAAFLNGLGVGAFKIGSGELTNLPLIAQVSGYGKPMILSTGMAVLAEVREAVKTAYSSGNKKIILLHCTSCYPAKHEDLNLRAMETLKREFSMPVGYSDHTEGIEIALCAVAMGASVIEKHFTLDKNISGPDHKASLVPGELKNMIMSVRNIEKAMGDGIKRPSRSEADVRALMRKSIVAASRIPKGKCIDSRMLNIKRPGTGIEPKFLKKIIGKKALADIREDEVLTWEKVKL